MRGQNVSIYLTDTAISVVTKLQQKMKGKSVSQIIRDGLAMVAKKHGVHYEGD